MTEQITLQDRKPAVTAFPRQPSLLRRILVVEDDPDIRWINAMVLHHAGYHVDTAVDGASGWSALKASRYDVLITDNNMPRVTGMELIKKVRSEEMPLSVILASGTAPTEELEQNPWLQIDAVLLKPYTSDAILASVKQILHNADDQQEFGSLDLKDNKTPQAVEQACTALQRQPDPAHRILVVDDDGDLRRLNAEVLIRFGYHVDTAEDGTAGWEALQASRHAPECYTLLITDHEMPGLSGLALVKKLRAARMALPVIMATGRLPTEDLMNRYPWLQPVATLVKPYSVEQLLVTVQDVLRETGGILLEIPRPPNRSPAGGLQL